MVTPYPGILLCMPQYNPDPGHEDQFKHPSPFIWWFVRNSGALSLQMFDRRWTLDRTGYHEREHLVASEPIHCEMPDSDNEQCKAVKEFVKEWMQEHHTQGPAAVMYVVSRKQHIFQSRDCVVAALKRLPEAELFFTNNKDELFEFLAEDLEGKLQV
ncbi:hypothetical protein DFH08DRAFT_801566 [Mycena albidolilacea]|uniref:Uncharacterized protein n=1 Tax=Mycena albidolilacea TaxID=1033008 RepID=A0AAD7EZH3_9AGAR|nr:hypothetical protein DFH08DRAFT_801566 [Mycena albidolilacea]